MRFCHMDIKWRSFFFFLEKSDGHHNTDKILELESVIADPETCRSTVMWKWINQEWTVL